MQAQAKTSTVAAKTLIMLFLVMIIAIFMMKPFVTSSITRAQQERIFEDTIPKGVPIKIKIKKEKEKSFKDLKNEKWLSEFELELTNTGDKPIYFLDITLITDVRVGGERLAFPQVFGRAELGDIVSKAQPDDPSIKPGETYVFKMGEIPAWERGVREKHFPEATRLRAELQSISFGDGTGYFGNHPYPPADKKQSSLEDHIERPDAAPPSTARNEKASQAPKRKISWTDDGPAIFLPANFLFAETSDPPLSIAADSNESCMFDFCVPVVPWRGVVCYDNDRRLSCTTQNRPTYDSDGVCMELV